MSSPKERHYWAQLRTALTAGQWHSNSPAKTPHGDPLSWSELFRKFRKHCRGAHDIAHVASHTHTLALLISEDEVEDYDTLPLAIDTECLVVEEGRLDKVKAGYEQLKSLQSSNLDTINFTLAYYAYALGNPALCIAHLEKVPELHQVRNHTPNADISNTNLLAPSIDTTVPEVRDGRALAMTESLRSICLQGMALEILHPTTPSIALQTYCSVLPHLFPSLKSQFTHKSLLSYNQNLSSPSIKQDFTVFHQLRELWRWVERIIWRAVVLCTRVYDVRKGWNGGEENENEMEGDSLWTWLLHYTYYSAYWPSTFRTSHRSTIASTHIRALIILYRPSPSATLPFPPSPYSSLALPSPSPKPSKKCPPAWLDQARLAIQDYQAILSASTTFPRAGTRNEKVEEFVDLCVAVWETNVFGGGRGHVDWVINILWWATRLTFNSSRILRHMTRLLYLSGDDMKLAKRVLKLYIQVVGKAYETSGKLSRPLGPESGSAGECEEDTDTDSNWVDTLIFGAIMLCKSASSSTSPFFSPSSSLSPPSSILTEMDDLNEAYQMIEQAKTRLDRQDRRLLGKVFLVEGIYWMIFGIKGQDPLTRPTHLSLSHSLLLQSVEADPTPSGYYHLALSYAIPGGSASATKGSTTICNNSNSNNANSNLRQAIEYAGLAVESDSGDVRYWHLLGLLLAAQERWEDAREVLERGADLAVVEHDADGVKDEAGEVVGLPRSGDGLTYKFSPEIHILSQSPCTTLSLPPASTLLLTPPPSKYPPSPYDLFECHLQLRMTQGTVIEVVEGAEGAEGLWLEVFGWVAERRNAAAAAVGDGTTTINDGSLHHLDPNLNTHNQPQPNYLGALINNTNPNTQIYQTQNPASNNSSSDSNTNESIMDPLPPPISIPIMISPATPTENGGEGGAILGKDKEREKEMEKEKGPEKEGKDQGKEKKTKRSISVDIEKDHNNSNRLDVQQKAKKNVGQMLKGSVKKSRAGITAATKKLGHGVVRHGGLRRSTSTPDFHVVFQQSSSYQASSIHSRRRLSFMSASRDRPLPAESPPPPLPTQPSTSPTPTITGHQDSKRDDRSMKENRLLSDLWLMSAATFRRLGKIDQAKGAIQEAEVSDENNPAVWVQFGLYYIANGLYQHAVDTFQKALFICPDDVAATVHLSRLYLDPDLNARLHSATTSSSSEAQQTTDASDTSDSDLRLPTNTDVDLAAGMLSYLTKGKGWNIPEAWYYLAKAYGLQGRKEEEKETLRLALELSERRGVRDIGSALGWCCF